MSAIEQWAQIRQRHAVMAAASKCRRVHHIAGMGNVSDSALLCIAASSVKALRKLLTSAAGEARSG